MSSGGGRGSSQRERIIDALARVCAAKGYRAATVEDIIDYAGVSRRTFYDLFQDKRQCFLVAYELAMGRVLTAVEAAYEAAGPAWPERIAAGLATLLEQLAAEPVRARLVMVEVLAAGKAALVRRDAQLTRFEAFFEPGRARLPAAAAEQELLARAVVGGLAEALYARVVTDETERLPEIGPELLYCALVPYLGHADALALSQSAR